MNERIFNNRYRIESRLGNGGMAIVYAGTDTLLRRRVAVKVLRDQYAADDDFVKRFYYEAQSAAKLSHPNIVNVYDVGREGDEYYIVMELVDGETLAEQIGPDKAIPEPVAIDYAAQIASGLAYAHRQGILHRDIKPANILVTKDDVVKLSDFGIARAVAENASGVTQPGMVMGSVYYISPEQAQGFEIDETSDLYSLGVVIYQMVTGKLPYTGETPVTVALKHVSDPVPTIPTSRASPALASIVTRLLQKNPRDRFQSASDVATALREARERPTITQNVGAGVAADGSTMLIPTVRAPQPPPRRSASPDRPQSDELHHTPPNGNARVPVEVHETGPRQPMIWVGLVALLLVAATAGFIIFGRSGTLFGPAKNIALPDFKGASSAQAQQAIIKLGLVPQVTATSDPSVAPDRVISETPGSGTKLAQGDTVALVVSNGAPLADVPNVKGYTRDAAQRELDRAKFKMRFDEKYSKEARDTVIAESGLGTRLREGSVVTLVVSKGLELPLVPSIVSLSLDDARARLTKLGLKLGIADRAASDNIPADSIASQDPASGVRVDPGTIVSVVVSTGSALVAVPDVGNASPGEASDALRAAGFVPKVQYSVQPSDASGKVISQTPAPNSQAHRGSSIAILIAVPGTVPDVSGMSLDDAKRAISLAGYKVGNITFVQDGVEGTVIRTEPEANATLTPGDAVVTLYYNQPSAAK